jgi:DNA polymerase delta subunit 1
VAHFFGLFQVRSFETEGEMLEEWAAFVREMDPDIFTGYNINNFDFPYLIERARHLKLKRFDFLGRILDIR